MNHFCHLEFVTMWLLFCISAFWCISLSAARVIPTKADFMEARERALAHERVLSIGGDLQLSPKEDYVNQMILVEKAEVFKQDRLGNIPYLPGMHFIQAQPLIANSSIYKFIQRMPKGGVLHIHNYAMVSLDWLIKNVTYRENLFACDTPDSRLKFKFSASAPASTPECQTEWRLVSDLRTAAPDVEEFDNTLKRKVSMLNEGLNITQMTTNELWLSFMSCFAAVGDLMFFEPVFRDYLYQAMTEFHADNVQYMEIRILLTKTYNLDGTQNDALSILETYKDVATEFKMNNPTSSGMKVIVTDIRNFDNSVIASTISDVLKFKKSFPDFIAGFDLVAQEDLGQPLLHYLDELMAPNSNNPSALPYYFHAGETDWQGTQVDENLIDAILLGTKRIGHGYAVPKHPWAMEQIKTKQIAIEVNPISNQVLGLVSDLRNHAAVSLIAQNFPIVISCDDPPMWGATGLSYDFYIAFMGMTGANTGLEFLKGIAMNSLKYSAMSDSERKEAMDIWADQWDFFIDEMAGNVTLM